jgi:hypothetical protein
MVEELTLISQPNGRYTSARVPYAILGKQVVRQRLLMDRLAGASATAAGRPATATTRACVSPG